MLTTAMIMQRLLTRAPVEAWLKDLRSWPDPFITRSLAQPRSRPAKSLNWEMLHSVPIDALQSLQASEALRRRRRCRPPIFF